MNAKTVPGIPANPSCASLNLLCFYNSINTIALQLRWGVLDITSQFAIGRTDKRYILVSASYSLFHENA